MGEFTMPSLGAGMDTGKVVEWCVAPGDEVHRGDIIAVVETDKAAIEVEVFEDGVVDALLVDEGTKVPVGTALARLRRPDEEPAPPGAEEAVAEPVLVASAPAPSRPTPATSPRPVLAARGASAPPPPAPVPAAAPAPPPAPAPAPKSVGRSSPYARRLATEQGVDLATVRGSGPGGAVVAADLGAPPGPASVEEEPVDRATAMRQAIGRAMAQSKREIPHYYLGLQVDVEDTLRWLEDRNADRPPTERVLPAALVLKATALTCAEFPDLNGFWVDDGFRPATGVHVGVAISLRGGGLVAPAIRDTDRLSLDACMAALTDLVARARGGRLRGSEISDPTVTLTNLGDRGVDSVLGIIYPPQVALVGTGRIRPMPWPDADGTVTVRRVVDLSLAGDHRASDGHRGGRFLAALAHHLAEPETL